MKLRNILVSLICDKRLFFLGRAIKAQKWPSSFYFISAIVMYATLKSKEKGVGVNVEPQSNCNSMYTDKPVFSKVLRVQR